ncbi:MAG: hypothetical protein ABI748_01960, partial [Dokdonella sp.]
IERPEFAMTGQVRDRLATRARIDQLEEVRALRRVRFKLGPREQPRVRAIEHVRKQECRLATRILAAYPISGGGK